MGHPLLTVKYFYCGREADMPPHILAVFNQLFDELKSMKQQQWTITNYGLLILGAIYAVKLSGVPHSQTYLKILAGGSQFSDQASYYGFSTTWLDHATA